MVCYRATCEQAAVLDRRLATGPALGFVLRGPME